MTIFCLNLLVGARWACIQNFIILALVVFEIAWKKTLNLCFGRRPKLKHLFFCLNLLVRVKLGYTAGSVRCNSILYFIYCLFFGWIKGKFRLSFFILSRSYYWALVSEESHTIVDCSAVNSEQVFKRYTEASLRSVSSSIIKYTDLLPGKVIFDNDSQKPGLRTLSLLSNISLLLVQFASLSR